MASTTRRTKTPPAPKGREGVQEGFTVRYTSDTVQLEPHIQYLGRMYPGLVWMGGNWHNIPNILIDRHGTRFTFHSVTIRGGFPAEPLYLIESDAPDSHVWIVTQRTFWTAAERLRQQGRTVTAYQDILDEIYLRRDTRMEWEQLVRDSTIRIDKDEYSRP